MHYVTLQASDKVAMIIMAKSMSNDALRVTSVSKMLILCAAMRVLLHVLAAGYQHSTLGNPDDEC